MEEKPLERIPFSIEDELMIMSMAKWKKFVAVFHMIGGGLLILGAVFVSSYVSSKLMGDAAAPVAVIIGLALAIGGVLIWQGSLLYSAGEFFDLVAKTDDADQDYVAKGFGKLKMFFIVEGVVGGLSVLGSISNLFNN